MLLYWNYNRCKVFLGALYIDSFCLILQFFLLGDLAFFTNRVGVACAKRLDAVREAARKRSYREGKEEKRREERELKIVGELLYKFYFCQ